MDNDRIFIGVKVTAKQKDLIKRIADNDFRTMSSWIRKIISTEIERLDHEGKIELDRNKIF